MSTQSLSLDSNSIAQLDRIIRSHRDEMTRVVEGMMDRISGSGLGSSMGFGGMRRGGNNEEYRRELESFLAIMKNNNKALTASEQYQRNAAKREMKVLEQRIKAEKEAAEAADRNTDSQDENTGSQDRNRRAVDDATNRLGDWAKGLVAGTLKFEAVTRAVNEFEQAYKHGLNWNALSDTIHSAFTMGLSPKDMMDFQTKFRRVSNTFEDGIEGFTNVASANQVEWMKYTGNLKEAAFMQGQFTDVALSMGVGIKDVNGAVNTLFDRFKHLQSVTSMTAEQFVAIQRSMLAEQSVRDKLIGLQGKERLNYVTGLTQTNMAFRMMGMQEEVADRLVKFIEAQSTKGARNRLKEGAQLSIVAQTLGMDSASAQRLAALHRNRNKTAEESQEYAKLGQVLKDAQEKYRNSGTFNQGIASGEYLVDALGQIAPVLNEIGNMSSDGILQAGAQANQAAIIRQQEEIADRNEGLQGKVIESIVKFSNIFSAWGASALAALLGGVAVSRFGGRLFGGRGGPGGGPGGGGPGGGLLGTLGRFGKAGLVGIGVGAAGYAATAIADPQTEDKKNYWDKAAAGAALGATLGSVVPGLGTVAGGTIGGLLGLGYAALENHEVFADALTIEKNHLAEQMNAMELKYQFEQSAYKRQIEEIKEKGALQGSLDEAQKKRIEELTEKLNKSNEQYQDKTAKAAANSFAFNARNLVNTKEFLGSTAADIKGSYGYNYGTTDDVNKGLAGIQSKLKTAGVDLTLAEIQNRVQSKFQDIIADNVALQTDENMAINAGLGGGENADYSNFGDGNKLIGQAIEAAIPELLRGAVAAQQATVSSAISSSEQFAAMQMKIEDTVKQTEQLKAEREAIRQSSASGNLANTSEIDKRIKENEEWAALMRELVNKDTVKIDGIEPDTWTKLADALTKLAGNRQFTAARSRA